MSRGVSNKITYKPYNQNEQWLLPPSLDELVPENHFVRTVSKTVDELDIEKIFAKNTKGGGASRYNPIMLMKVLIYCYMTGTYSSRMISKQCRENVNVMWLTSSYSPTSSDRQAYGWQPPSATPSPPCWPDGCSTDNFNCLRKKRIENRSYRSYRNSGVQTNVQLA